MSREMNSKGEFVAMAAGVFLLGGGIGFSLGKRDPQGAPQGELEPPPVLSAVSEPSPVLELEASGDWKQDEISGLLAIGGDPRSVLALIRKKQDEDDAFLYSDLCRQLFESWVATDPQAAIDAASTLKNRALRGAAALGAVDGMFAGDPQKAQDLLVEWEYIVPWGFEIPAWLKEGSSEELPVDSAFDVAC